MKKPYMNCGTPITKEYCEDGWPNGCDHWTPKKPKTNADRIRAMTDEELAEFLVEVKQERCDFCDLASVMGACTESLCESAMERWLQQPAERE